MAERTFCTIEDLEGYESTILDLSETGNFNNELTAARKEIEDRLIISLIIEDLDKLGENIQPRQLRTPAIFLTLSMIFQTNAIDDESPYQSKADFYGKRFEAVYGDITVLDLDTDEDGVLEDTEENSHEVNYTRMTRT